MSSDDFTSHSMRVRFDAKLKVMSQKGNFPTDTVASVFVTNRDHCSYHEATVAKDGPTKVNSKHSTCLQHRTLHQVSENPIADCQSKMQEFGCWIRWGVRLQSRPPAMCSTSARPSQGLPVPYVSI